MTEPRPAQPSHGAPQARRVPAPVPVLLTPYWPTTADLIDLDPIRLAADSDHYREGNQ